MYNRRVLKKVATIVAAIIVLSMIAGIIVPYLA